MCRIKRLEKMILQFKDNISKLREELKSKNADKRARASDAITYARYQITEAEKVIQEEKGVLSHG